MISPSSSTSNSIATLSPAPDLNAPGVRSVADADVRPLASAPLVLVVDDHHDSRAIARIVLELTGFRVVEAETGTEALAIALQRRPDVILLDLILPGINGWRLARLFRSDARTRGTVLIALTALVDADDDAHSLAASCDEILLKPVSPRTLVAVVTRFVGMPNRPRLEVT